MLSSPGLQTPIYELDSLIKVNIPSDCLGGLVYLYSNNGLVTSYGVATELVVLIPYQAKIGDSFSVRIYKAYEFSEYSNSVAVTKATALTSQNKIYQASKIGKLLAYDDTLITDWTDNVLAKLTSDGIVPNYIERDEVLDLDRPYEIIWSTVAQFFAYQVAYSQKLTSNLFEDSSQITEYLTQKGLFFSNQESLTLLKNVLANFFKVISSRGGFLPFLAHETYQGLNSVLTKVEENYRQGEFSRLLNRSIGDEMAYEVYPDYRLSWNIDNSSPLYRGLEASRSLDKLSFLEGFAGLEGTLTNDNFPVIGGPTILDGVLSVDANNFLGSTNPLNAFEIPVGTILVDPTLDYQISFYVKGPGYLTFGFNCYDSFMQSVEPLLSARTGLSSVYFVKDQILMNETDWVLVTGFIYNYNKELNLDLTLFKKSSINSTHLKFHQNVSNLILILTSYGFNLQVKDLKLTPTSTNYSRGFVQNKNIASFFYKNKGNLSESQLFDELRRKFLSYNLEPVVTELSTFKALPDSKCQGTQVKAFAKTGKVRCLKYLGVNSGLYEEQYAQTNPCLAKTIKWVKADGFDFKKCVTCLPSGVDISFDLIVCGDVFLDFDSIACNCVNVSFLTSSCSSCEQNKLILPYCKKPLAVLGIVLTSKNVYRIEFDGLGIKKIKVKIFNFKEDKVYSDEVFNFTGFSFTIQANLPKGQYRLELDSLNCLSNQTNTKTKIFYVS